MQYLDKSNAAWLAPGLAKRMSEASTDGLGIVRT